MAPTKRTGLPDFWATGIAKILAGSQPCSLELWMKGHYRIEKRPREDEGSLAVWKTNHTAQLSAATDRFRVEGWKVDVERYFKVTGTTATLSGKVDLITQKPDSRPVIRDVKSGKPADSDVTQVMIYMVAIPLAWRSPDMVFDGEVMYPDRTVFVKPSEAQAIRPKLFELMRRLGSTDRPEANPSESACRFCELVDEDCGKRFVAAPVPVLTSEF
jgi:hypothetical protein